MRRKPRFVNKEKGYSIYIIQEQVVMLRDNKYFAVIGFEFLGKVVRDMEAEGYELIIAKPLNDQGWVRVVFEEK